MFKCVLFFWRLFYIFKKLCRFVKTLPLIKLFSFNRMIFTKPRENQKTSRMSAKRAPGPGAIRKVEWRPLAKKHLKDRCVILHTDAAKSYRLRMPGVLHDHVRHCIKRQKIKGKWVWKAPTYVKMSVRKDPKTGCQIKTKGGTQIVDRAWRYLKERMRLNQNCAVGSALMLAKVRSAQYEYWHRNQDLRVASGTLCAWHMAKIIAWLQTMKYAGKKSACACSVQVLSFSQPPPLFNND